jgi:hypothetical protein
MNARPLERYHHDLFRPVEIDIAGVNCIGLVSKVNQDRTVQVHAFHPSGIVVHDDVTLIDDDPLSAPIEAVAPDGDVPGGVPPDGPTSPETTSGAGTEEGGEQVPSLTPGEESSQGTAAEGDAGVPETPTES